MSEDETEEEEKENDDSILPSKIGIQESKAKKVEESEDEKDEPLFKLEGIPFYICIRTINFFVFRETNS